MSFTPYSVSNQLFSDAAHQLAAKEIYPQVFRCDASEITIQSMNVQDGGISAVYDGKLGIDKIIAVSVNGLRAPLLFSVQERFRRPKNISFQTLTITEWNHETDVPSELYKIKADLFVYGYYDEALRKLGRCIVADTSKLLWSIANKKIKFMPCRNERANQTYIEFKFTDLHAAGVLLWDSAQQGIQSNGIA